MTADPTRVPTKAPSRGFRAARCVSCCQLPSACICRITPRIETRSQFWLLTHADELRKPTNSGRLIAASIPNTQRIIWRGGESAELSALLSDARYAPYLVYPHGSEELFARLPEQANAAANAGRVPAFVLLDGTWDQARRMFQRSGFLRGLKHLTLPADAIEISNRPRLRRQRQPGMLSTAETAVALLTQAHESQASQALAAYYEVFAAQAFAARRGRALTFEVE